MEGLSLLEAVVRILACKPCDTADRVADHNLVQILEADFFSSGYLNDFEAPD